MFSHHAALAQIQSTIGVIQAGTDWKEVLHPRSKDGRFGNGGSGSGEQSGDHDSDPKERIQSAVHSSIDQAQKLVNRALGRPEAKTTHIDKVGTAAIIATSAAIVIIGSLSLHKTGQALKETRGFIKNLRESIDGTGKEILEHEAQAEQIQSLMDNATKRLDDYQKASKSAGDILSGALMDPAQKKAMIQKHGEKGYTQFNTRWSMNTPQDKALVEANAQLHADMAPDIEEMKQSVESAQKALQDNKTEIGSLEKYRKHAADAVHDEFKKEQDLKIKRFARVTSTAVELGISALFTAASLTPIADDPQHGLAGE